jgi:BTB/POZ domain
VLRLRLDYQQHYTLHVSYITNTNTVIILVVSANSNKRQGESHEEDNGDGKKPRKSDQIDSIIDYGSDDDLPEESIENRLSWRKYDDPFADWKIVILNTKSNQEITYNVRKSVRADGPRRSKYFVRLFENDGNFSEAQDKTSHIELNDLQAKAFPEFLDYMYSVGQKMSFTTDHTTALYSLAKYFGVARLQNEVKKFCLEDMQTVETCGTYYEHATTILQEEAILQPAAKYCRENIGQIISHTSRLLYVPDPQFWLDLMKEHAEKGTIKSKIGFRLSLHIAQFCIYHVALLSPEMFKQLTDESISLVSRSTIRLRYFCLI